MGLAEEILKNTSGKDIVEFIFKKFIYCLENEILGVHRIKNLRDEYGQLLAGCLYQEKIYLRHSDRRPTLIQTLIHELAHHVFNHPDKSLRQNEPIILAIEFVLWRMFSKKQKAALSKFIPRLASKKLPNFKK